MNFINILTEVTSSNDLNTIIYKLVTIGIIIIFTLILLYLNNLFFSKKIKLAKKRQERKKLTALFFFKKIVYAIIIFLGSCAILSQFSFFKAIIVPLLSGAGILSLILGLAAQDALSNFFSGFALVFGNPFEIGDFVKCVDNDISGEIEKITFRHTIIRTVDNKRYIIPNSKINNMVIENYDFGDKQVCRLIDYPISYTTDIDKAIKIVKEEVNKFYDPNTDGKKVEFPKVRVVSWGDSSVNLRVWIWGKNNSEAFENTYQLNKNLKLRFDKEKIEIPYQYINVVNMKEK